MNSPKRKEKEMGLDLTKGQSIDLTKNVPGLTKVAVGLGWDAVEEGKEIDLDAIAVLLTSTGKVESNAAGFVYFNNLTSLDGSVVHTGDNLTGDGDGDDETINIDLASVPSSVETIEILINSFNGQKFSEVKNAFVRVLNSATSTEEVRYDLGAEFSDSTIVLVARFTRDGSEWKFTAVGEGKTDDFSVIAASYGAQ